MKNYMILILSIILFTKAMAEKPEFVTLSMEEGLPGSNIRKIYQDYFGYIWIGIESAGLCRYDGRQFVNYEHNPEDSLSISNNFVWDIVSDYKNNLWIATENGLNFYDRNKNRFYHFFPNFDYYKEINNNWILSLMFDSEGDLWIGHNRGAHVIDHNQIKQLYSLIENDGNVQSFFSEINIKSIFKNSYEKLAVPGFYEDNTTNIIWICTSTGIFALNKNKSVIKHYKSDGTTSGLVNDKVSFIQKIRDDLFLIGTDRGLNKFNPVSGKFELVHFKINNGLYDLKGFTDALVDEKGKIWIALSEGIIIASPDCEDFNYSLVSNGEKELSSKIIRDLFRCRSGLIWVGTKFGGINIHNTYNQIFPHVTIEVDNYNKLNNQNSFVLCFYEDDQNRIWIGSKFGGLLQYNLQTSKIVNKFRYKTIDDKVFASRTECIFQLNDGNIITGTPRGISLFDPEFGWVKNIPFYMVNSIKRDSRGNLWLGSSDGLYLFNEKSLKTYSYEKKNSDPFFSNKNNYVLVIFEDRSGCLWFGTRENGIYIYNPNNETVEHIYHDPNNEYSLCGDMVRDISQDKYGRIWIATKHSGICYCDSSSRQFHYLSKLDGLPSNTIYSIQKDLKGNLWLGTHNGLSKMNIENLTFANYDKNHGLQDNIFENDARLITTDGRILIGGMNGFNVFYPDSIKIKAYKAPLIISYLKVNENKILTDINVDTSVNLKYNQNYLSFEFSLLDFRNPLKNNYKYMLEGIDKGWIETKNRNYVSYAKLVNGKYKFRLMAMNQDNVWEGPVTININIKPPLWRTNTAYVFYFMLAIFFFYIIHKLSKLSAKYSIRLNEAKIQIQRTMDLNRTKLQFFTNISHELRTPLSLIMAPIDNLLNSENIGWKERKDLEFIERNTKRLYSLINRLLYFRKTEQNFIDMKVMEGNIVEFIKEIVFPFYELAAKQKIIFNIDSLFDNFKIWFDPDKLEIIISNILLNAFKYTPPSGRISISFSRDIFNKTSRINFSKIKNTKESNEALKISISDTGKGMTKEQTQFISDRFYIGDDHRKGIGIGLEITRTLVEMHGGTLTVEAEAGKGTTFHIWLRLGKDHFKKEFISDQKLQIKDYSKELDHEVFLSELKYEEGNALINEEPDDLQNKPLILVVDDNKDLRYFLSLNLSKEFVVITAQNGFEGLILAKEKMPELILSDVMMPEMDGIEFCKQLKSDIATSHIPVILLTAKAEMENKLEGMAIGADDYVEKPFNYQFLQLKIRNILLSRQKLRKQIIESLNDEIQDDLKISEYDRKFLENCKKAIDQNVADPKFGVAELSRFVGMSRSQLHRKLKALTDNSPIEWIYNFRLTMAKKMLKEKKYNVSDVAYMTGFNSPSSFSTVFRKKFGIAPSEVLEKHSNNHNNTVTDHSTLEN